MRFVTCRNSSQVVKLYMRLLQHPSLLPVIVNVAYVSWPNEFCRATKIIGLSGVSTCHATAFKSLRHIHVSLRQTGGALPYKPIRDVPFFRVSFFSINS